MRAVRGHYDGSVVVLDEPAPLEGQVDVIVPSEAVAESPGRPNFEALQKSWEDSRRRLSGLGAALSDELRRQRDDE